MRKDWAVRAMVVALVLMVTLSGAGRVTLAEGGVEQRIADFWKRLDAMQPGDHLSSADLGQWALNVIERDARSRMTVTEFRVSTGGMQVAMERAGRAPAPTKSAPSSGGIPVEQRIADFWKRIDATHPGDYLSSADLGQWALNVIERDASARITLADFRVSTGGMQVSLERAARVPYGTLPLPSFIQLELDQNVGAKDDIGAVIDGVARAQRYYEAQIGPNPIRAEFIKVYYWIPVPADQDPQGNGVCCPASPTNKRILIRANHPQWIQGNFGGLPIRLGRQWVMAHEQWHLWQNAMGCPAQDYRRPTWPVWIGEGGAEFMAWQVMLGSGLIASSVHAANERQMIAWAAQFNASTLQSYEAIQYGDNNAYWLGYFGTKRLVARAGLLSLQTFCARLGAGAAWQTAFSDAFGITPAAFYADYEAWRANGFR